MGHLVNGIWETTSTKEVKKDGQFVRKASAFRNWVTVDGSPGPTGDGGFKGEPGRYHLYVSYACPWAHRALIYRSILGLEDAIDVSVVHPVNMENGWEFSGYPGSTPDAIHNAKFMHQVYTHAQADYSGKVTVPVLPRGRHSRGGNGGRQIRPFGCAGMQRWSPFLPEGD